MHQPNNHHWMRRLGARIVVLGLVGLLSGCDGDSPDDPFQEIYDQGVDRHLGQYTPMQSSVDGEVINHTFGTGEGPLCLDGSAYSMSTRSGSSAELVIFLEGGGACWSTFCVANETAGTGVPQQGVLNPALANNPLADANVAYFPYCDGSLFTGDVDNEVDSREGTEYQRGLANLSAGLDVAANTFPSPSRIVLAGNSGGGFGTIFALPLVRKLYPSVPIAIINDSGLGLGRDDEPGYQAMLFDDWNSAAFLPSSICPDCLESGHLTEYFRWQLAQDDNFRLAMLTSKQDAVIGSVFLQVGGEAFEDTVLRELPRIEAFADGRMRSWIDNGSAHTYIQRDVDATAGGVTVLQWLTDYLNGDADWQSVVD